MRLLLLNTLLVSLAVSAQPAATPEAAKPAAPATPTYSQKMLLKNWALSVCLAKVAKTAEAKDDANATAAAYMEFGKQSVEAYEPLRELADRYAKRVYGGAARSEFNTMKCIDLLHSKELDALTARLAKASRK